MWGISPFPAVTYFRDIIVPWSDSAVERARCVSDPLWGVVLLMRRCITSTVKDGCTASGDDLRACIVRLDVVGFSLVFGNQQDAADCMVYPTLHEKVPFDRYPPSWCSLAPWAVQSGTGRGLVSLPSMSKI